MVLSGLEAF